MSERREWHLLVGGERRAARSGRTATGFEPGTAKPLADVAQAGLADVDDTLAIATAEFESGDWPRRSATERGRILEAAARLLRERAEDFAVVEARGDGHAI